MTINDDDEDGQTTNVTMPTHFIAGARGKAGHLMVSSSAGGVCCQMFELTGAQMTLGRGVDVGIRIDDDGISRTHARFVTTAPGCFRVEDLGSSSGRCCRSRPSSTFFPL